MKKLALILFIFTSYNSVGQTIIDSLFSIGNYEKCYQLIEKNNTDTDIQYKINCLIRLNRIFEAEQILNTYNPTLKNNIYLKKSLNSQILLHKGLINEAKNELLECESYFKNNNLQLSDIYNQLSLCSWAEGNLAEGRDFLEKALRIRVNILGENNLKTLDIYNNLGLIEFGQQNFSKSKEYFANYLKKYEYKFGENHPSVAIALNNLSNIYKEENKLDSALILINKSLTIRGLIYNKKHSNYAFCLVSKAEILKLMNNYDNAIELLNQADSIYENLYGNRHPEIASIYNSLADIYSLKKEYTKALIIYQKAQFANSNHFEYKNISENTKISDYKNSNILLNTLYSKSMVLYKLFYEKTLNIKYLKNSLSALQTADSLINKVRQEKEDKKDKLELGKSASNIYEHAIKVCFTLSESTIHKQYYLKKAFYYSEKNKASILMESIAESNARKFAGIPDSILVMEANIKANLSYYENLAFDENIQNAKDSLFKYKKMYTNLINSIETKYPSYYQLKYSIDVCNTSNIAEIQKLNPRLQVISYTVSDLHNEIYIFNFTTLGKICGVRKSINPLFFRYLTGIKNSISFQNFEQFKIYNQKVSKTLVSFHVPQNTESLVIIPDGKLSNLPFELLLSKSKNFTNYENAPFLIKKYNVSYHLSTTLFCQKSISSNFENKILICAPVQFNNSKDEERNHLATLIGTEKEAIAIDSLARKNNLNSTIFLDKNATEEKIKKSNLSQYGYIHFATHGTVNQQFPELSKIYLYSSNPSEKEDGALYTNEIFNLSLNAKLVTLSACETGKGQISKGEGVIGLSRSLVYAGAKNLVVSHWKVSDQATATLMADYYKNIFMDKSLSYSLREAKLNLIKSNTYSAPYYWAPFVLIGK